MGKAKRFFGPQNKRNERLTRATERQTNAIRSQNILPDTQLQGVKENEVLNTQGGVMFGPTGGMAQSLAISSGILDLKTNTAGKTVKVRPIIFLATETGTSDTLDAIDVGGEELFYQSLRIVGVTGNTITITHAFGSATGTQRAIQCPDDENFTLSGNNVIDLLYDETTNNWLIVGTTGGAGTTGTGTFVTASMSVDHPSARITANNHVEFDTKDADGGIVLQTGSEQANGIFELIANRSYKISGQVRPEFSAAGGSVELVWYDITNSAELGARAIYEAVTGSNDDANKPLSEHIFTPSTNITVELRIIAATSVSAFANEYTSATLFELGASGGVAGSTIYDVDNQGSKSGTVTHDLNISTRHKLKFTMTGNATLAFTNYPATDKGIDWYVEITVDSTGGYTLTWPSEVTDPPVASFLADRKFLFACHSDDNGSTVEVVNLSRDHFAIEPAVTDNSSTWTGTQTLDLGVGDGHIYKWIVDQDLTFASAVSNKPTSGRQRTFELEFEHDGVGGAFTVTLPSNFADENGNTLASFSISSGTALLTCRINDGTNFLVLQKNVTGTTAGLTQTPWTSNIDADGFDLFDLDILQLDQATGSVLTSAATGVTSNTSGDFKHNIPNTGVYEWSEENVSKMQLENDSGVTTLDLISPTLGSTLNLGAGANIGSITKGSATLEFTDPTAMSWLIGVTEHLALDTNGLDVKFKNISNIADLNSGTSGISLETDSTGMTLNVDTGDELFVKEGASKIFDANSTRIDFDSKYLQMISITSPGVTGAANVGRLFFDSTTSNHLSVIRNGSVIDLEDPTVTGFANEQLSNLSGTVAVNVDLDPSSTDVRDIGNSTFRWADLFIQNIDLDGKLTINDTSTKAAADGEMVRDGSTIELQIPQLRVSTEDTLSTGFAHLNLAKVDASPGSGDVVGNLSFSIDDSGTLTTYARVHAEAADVTDAGTIELQVRTNGSATFDDALVIEGSASTTGKSFMAVNAKVASNLEFEPVSGGTDYKIFPSLNQLGISVEDNTSYTVGAQGTIAIPTHNMATTPTAAQLDTEFGTHKGASGLDEPTTPGVDNARLFVRNSDGSWYSFNASARFT
jgi:hypothetical protein